MDIKTVADIEAGAVGARARKWSAKTVATIAMLSVVAFLAKLVSNVLPEVAGFLSFDLRDIVIVIGGFICGPLVAAIIAVITAVVEMLTISSTGPIGLVMNIVSSCSFAWVASVIYQKNHSMKGAVVSLVTGVIVMTGVMVLWNYLITPLYMHVDRSVVAGMLLSVFLPFNLVKGGINATLTMLLYKPVVTALRRAKLVEPASGDSHGVKWTAMAVSALLLVSFALLALVLADVI